MSRPIIVAAMTSNRVIGNSTTNSIPWDEPDDMTWFKGLTEGSAVVMGHRTFMSINGIPLRNRHNVVMTHAVGNIPSVTTVHNLQELQAECAWNEIIYAIGGRSVYESLLPIVNEMFITIFNFDAEGDVLFPEFDASEWNITMHCQLEHGQVYRYSRINPIQDDGWDTSPYEDDDVEYEDEEGWGG